MAGSDESLRVRVGDTKLEDVAEGRARLSRDVFRSLRLQTGDVVRISGAHHILATAIPADAEDDGLTLARLDGTQRRKLGVELGGTVEVRRHEPKSARYVRLLAIGDDQALTFSAHDLRAVLAEQPVIAGDTFTLAPDRRDFEAQVSVLGLNLVEVTGSSAGAHAATVRVVETRPPGVVQVTADTELDVVRAGEDEDDGSESDA